jgi:hypothetical protein
MNHTISTSGFVNSSGYVHVEEDVFLWTASLIRGTGAIMGITIIPTVPMSSIWKEAYDKIALKCKQINQMGIPILLRFGPDMNGIIVLM